jgi:hypothetical protein
MTWGGRRASASGQALAIGGSVGRDVKVDINHITNVIEKESYPGLSVEPPTGRLPGHLRGREAICAGIATLIDSYAKTRDGAASLVFSGLGGVGKSAVALYACQYAIASKVSAFWVSSGTGAPISVSLWRVARELAEPGAGLPESPSQDGVIDSVWRVLEATSKPWLIVFDNADDAKSLAADGYDLSAGNGWARASGNGLVIVTSRLDDPGAWPQGFQTVIVESLSSDSGADLLLDLVSGKHPNARGERQEAMALAERLGGLPLALRAAGRYIDETATTTAGMFADYTRALDSRFAAALGPLPDARQDSTAAANRESVLATWSLSVEHLVDSGYWQVPQIMNILSCLDPSGIPPSLISRVQDYLAPPGASDLAAGPDLLATLRAMRNFGLVDFAPSQEKPQAVDNERVITDDSTMQVHRLVADVFDHALRGIPEEARPTYAATIKTLVAVMTHARKMGSAGFLDASLVAPHCARVTHSASRSPELYDRRGLRQFVKAIGGVTELMFPFLPSSDSLRILQQFLTLAESIMRRHAKPVRQIRHSLAHEFWKAKENDRAIQLLVGSQSGYYRLYCKLLPGIFHPQLTSLHSFILPGAVGEVQADVALTTLRTIKRMPFRSTDNSLKHRINLAVTLARHGHPDIAEAEFRNIVTAYGRRGPKYQLEELRARASLADALRDNGNLAESEQQYKGILGAADRILPESDSIALASRFGLAVIMHLRGENVAAEDLLRQLLDDETRILGATNPSTIATRFELAGVLAGQDRLADAEAEYRAVLAAETTALGAEDPSTLANRFELARVLAGQDRPGDAEAEYRAVLDARTRALGAEDRSTLVTRFELAGVLAGQDRPGDAEAEYRAVLAAGAWPAEDPSTLAARHELARVLARQGRPGDAEAEYRAVLDARTRALGAEDPSTLITRFELAWVLARQDRPGDAEAE